MYSVGMSLGGMVIVMGTVVNYFGKVGPGKVRHAIGDLLYPLLAAMVLTVGGVVMAVRGGAIGVGVIVPAVISTMFSSILFFFLAIRKTPVGDIVVAVGDAMLPFEAVTSEGERFHTDELTGQRTLLKFFRGGW